LLASALATLLVISMAGCASLSVDNATRAVLTLAASGLSLLCASILLEDMLVRPLLKQLRALARKLQLLTE
jgi:hypothetical protein